MSFVGPRFLKNLTGDGSDGSEVSEVNLEDIEKIIKSVDDLDKDVFGIDSPQKKIPAVSTRSPLQTASSGSVPVKTPRRKKISPGIDNEMADLSISDEEAFVGPNKADLTTSQKPIKGEEIKLSKSKKIVDLFGLDDDVLRTSDLSERKELSSRGSNTKRGADWLGLKDSPSPHHSNVSFSYSDKILDHQAARCRRVGKPNASPVKAVSGGGLKVGAGSGASRSEEVLFSGSKNRSLEVGESLVRTQKRPVTARPMTATTNILDDIFGTEGHTSSVVKETEESAAVTSKKGYEPSLGEVGRRRPVSSSRRRETQSAQILNRTQKLSGQPDDIDWLFEAKQTNSMGMAKSQVGDAEKDSGGLPEWLRGSGEAQNNKELAAEPLIDSSKFELQDKKEDLHPATQCQSGEERGEPLNSNDSKGIIEGLGEMNAEGDGPPLSRGFSGSVTLQLEKLQKELGKAMALHQNNLQKYMKVIIQEAEITESIGVRNPISMDEYTQEKVDTVERIKNDVNYIHEQNEKDDLIHELKMDVQRLEMLSEQARIKIEIIEAAHKLELTSIHKAHEHEIALWTARVERLQQVGEDMQNEMETRLGKLKSNEEDIIRSYKHRIAILEEERLADLKQLGEFHRLAMEQVTNLTVYYPNARSGLKLPLRFPQKPSDGEELTEREKSLLEKERQLQVKEAELVSQKEDLEDEKHKEKAKCEERERELKRALAEAKFKEELHSSELVHEKNHLGILKAEIERMKEMAVKEQASLTMEKLSLAAEKAKFETAFKLQQGAGQNMSNFDLLQGRAELEAALSTAREAQEVAAAERRKTEEMRRDMEAITWQQQAKDQQLDNREKHIKNMLEESKSIKEGALKDMENAKQLRNQVLTKEQELREQISKLEAREKEVAKERMELAKEKIEMDRRKAQLELVLPELTPAESLVIKPPRQYIDAKALIMKLKAEKELDSYFAPQQGGNLRQ